MAIVIGFAGPTVLIYSVAHAAHLSTAAAMSWVAAYTIISGLTSIVLSLATRTPVLTAWSTPGIAFLVTALVGVPFREAVGAFIVSNILVLLIGSSSKLLGWVQNIPNHLAAALNAAILLPFGFHMVTAMQHQPLLVGLMVLAFFALRRFAPLWAVAGALGVGVLAGGALGLLHLTPIAIQLTPLQVVMPAFSWPTLIGLSLPLTLLAFTGQFLPGFAVLKISGYTPAPAPIVRLCGAASIVAAFFGCHNITLAAVLANIVSGPEAHPDASKRYTAAVWAGVFYIGFGLFAGTFLQLLAVLPTEATQALAGLALLGAVTSSLQAGFKEAPGSLAAPVVLLVTLSGASFLGIGSAFWGILAGMSVYLAERPRQPKRVSAAVIEEQAA